MFKASDKSGIYKTDTKALQNLWKIHSKEGIFVILDELKNNDVCDLEVENDEKVTFFNRRMIREKQISVVRIKSVSNRYNKQSTKPLQKSKKQSTKPLHPLEYDIEYDNDNETVFKRGVGKENHTQQKIFLGPAMVKIFQEHIADYPADQEVDYPACTDIAQKIAKAKGWPTASVTNGKMPDVLREWEILVKFGSGDDWYATQSISMFNKKFQELVLSSKKPKKHAGERPKENRGYTGATNGFDPNRIKTTGAGDDL